MALSGKQFKHLISSQARDTPPAEPRCPHAGECGGCAFQEHAYAGQVAAKTDVLNRLWQGTAAGEAPPATPALVPPHLLPLECVPSPDPYNYRTRMDYVATKGRFGLRKPGRFNYIVELQTCHLIPPSGFQAALAVWQQAGALDLPDYNIRSHEGFLRYIVVRRSPQDQLLLAAVTAEGDYAPQMEALAALALAQPGVIGFHWLLNNSLTDLSFGTPLRHWGAATLPMQVGSHMLQIGPNTFFQNNVHLLLPLLDAVKQAILAGDDPPAGRLADLYSGVGAIALHLAADVGSVVAVESHPESTDLARHNITHNQADNVSTETAEVLDFLRQQAPGSFDSIIADPPRIGLGADVCRELLRLAPRRIVYVSCNPLTQHEDVGHLSAAYRLTHLRGYDMFPHTPHVESLAVLEHADAA